MLYWNKLHNYLRETNIQMSVRVVLFIAFEQKKETFSIANEI